MGPAALKEVVTMAKRQLQINVEKKGGYTQVTASGGPPLKVAGLTVTGVPVRLLDKPARSERSIVHGSMDVELARGALQLYGLKIVSIPQEDGAWKTFLAPMNRKGDRGRLRSARLGDELQEKLLQLARQLRDYAKAQMQAEAAEAEAAATK